MATPRPTSDRTTALVGLAGDMANGADVGARRTPGIQGDSGQTYDEHVIGRCGMPCDVVAVAIVLKRDL